jgi:phospholipid transport system substrate-binding protein
MIATAREKTRIFGMGFAAALAFVVALLAAAMSSDPALAAANPAEAFVQQNIDRGYMILNGNIPQAQRRMEFRQFMLSLTDPKRIGLFTLGPYARSASKMEVDDFIDAFTNYAVAIYQSRLGKYRGQTLKVTGSQERAPDDVIVFGDVVNPKNPDAPPIKAAFRVRKDAQGKMIVTDMQVEGVWLALSERSDFTGFLQQHNGSIPALTADLKRQTQQLEAAG